MSAVKCRQLEHCPDGDPCPGDWWWDSAARVGIFICLPTGQLIYVPGHADTSHQMRARWTLTGDGCEITASPSINLLPGVGHEPWHGWLRHGELISC